MIFMLKLYLKPNSGLKLIRIFYFVASNAKIFST